MENQPTMTTTGQRLRYYIENVLGETLSQYSQDIGLPAGSTTISNYCRDKYQISPKSIRKMIIYDKEFPVGWILKGEGSIPEKKTSNSTPRGKERTRSGYNEHACERYLRIIESQMDTIVKQNETIVNLSGLLKKEEKG